MAVLVVTATAFATISASAASHAADKKHQPATSSNRRDPTEIHIAVVADAALAAADVRDTAQGFARYINASCPTKDRCLAGRKLVVDFYDSRRSDRNPQRRDPSVRQRLRHGGDGAPTAMLESVADMRNCKDQAGKTIGIPDIRSSPSSRASNTPTSRSRSFRSGFRCATKDRQPQTYDSQVGHGFYYIKKYGSLHRDLPVQPRLEGRGTTTSSSATVGYAQHRWRSAGHSLRPRLRRFHCSAARVHSVRPYDEGEGVQLCQCGQPYTCTVLLRSEATTQGVADQVKVWDCLTCYDQRFLQTGVDVDDTYVDTGYLPFYDAKE